METPEKFSFPFEPYEIQVSFMRKLYGALEEGKLGIFESPTGTGKSLSICCAAIQWLKDHNKNEISDIVSQINRLKEETTTENSDNASDWLNSEYDRIKKNNEIFILQKKLDAITIQNDKIEKLRSRRVKKESNFIKRKVLNKKNETKTEELNIKKLDNEKDQNGPEEDDEFLLEEKNECSDSDNEESEMTKNAAVKIYFCSRTHSQLSQFINEIKKTDHRSDVSVISLASRQQYCINPSVLRLKSQALINESCLDLQRGKKGKATLKSDDGKVTKRSKKSSGCPYFNQTNVEELKDEALIDIKDVEDLIDEAKTVKACPYYGARAAVEDAQVIVVPYQTLLHKSTRAANGISLKDNIVIIDEAHNLLETIGHIHSAEINGHQLQIAAGKLKHYRSKYSARFATKNLLSLNQIIFVVGRILNLLKNTTTDEVLTIGDFVMKAEIDNYNLRPLLDFCNNSKLAQKLHGFADKYPIETVEVENKVPKKHGLEMFIKKISKEPKVKEEKVVEVQVEEETEKRTSIGNVIQTFVAFLEALTSTYADGRILTRVGNTFEASTHRFMLLNPAAQFYDVINEARAVIVAGGTMQPFSEFRDQLFAQAGAARDRIVEFSCGHVIPPKNILPICLSEGPSGKRFSFTYESRRTPEMLDEVGRSLINLCNVIPGGIVCFFPSYDYEKLVYNYLSSNGIIDKIQHKKKVFREPKTTAQVDSVLENYSKVIKQSKSSSSGNITGALMLSVVGGKLSEGLNFSDDLGRCVIVIGLPYPNLKSAELQEKMKYLKENVSATAGNVYYENLCMKAVNQCIGRAVRHANDYACVVLMDERYSRDSVRNALPKWIQESLVSDSKFNSAFGSIRKFFTSHKNS